MVRGDMTHSKMIRQQWNAILDLWEKGHNRVDIAVILGLPRDNPSITCISDVVYYYRLKGDPRAKRGRWDAAEITRTGYTPSQGPDGLAKKMGIETTTKMVLTYTNGVTSYVPVSLPRVRFLEEAA